MGHVALTIPRFLHKVSLFRLFTSCSFCMCGYPLNVSAPHSSNASYIFGFLYPTMDIKLRRCMIFLSQLIQGAISLLEIFYLQEEFSAYLCQGHRENSEALGQERKARPPESQESRKCSGSRNQL